MRILIASLAWVLLAAACGPAPKPEGPLVKEGPAVSDNCCCKSSPITSVDGLPVFEANTNRMECSGKQGTCVDDVQCQNKDAPEGPKPTPQPPAEPQIEIDP